MPVDVPAAHRFFRANARVVDLHVHAALFDGSPPEPVVAALAAYQNPDGGFAHGLEPDTRSPHSQPLDVEVAFQRLHAVGATGAEVTEMAQRACDFLAVVAASAGTDAAVPLLLPTIDGHPVASHWEGIDPIPPGFNPTAGAAAFAHALGVAHPWVDAATEWCFTTLEAGDVPTEGHACIEVARLLHHAPDRARAEQVAPSVAEAVPASTLFQLRPDPEAYGVTPLHLAPTPDALARTWFDDDVITAHLDALAADQQPDGGWPIRWQPPGEAGIWEWRAIVTLQATTTLQAYDRL